MIVPQNGIFAQGTHSHYFLELDILPGVKPKVALASLAALRAPEVSAGGINFVIAFGSEFWRAIAPTDAPPDLGPFKEIQGPGNKHVPATQHDVFLWFNGSTPDVVFDHARNAWRAVRDVTRLASEQPCFVYKDSRDLTGFIDGTKNPSPLDAPTVALIPAGQPGGGGSHVMAMRFVHDLDAFNKVPVEEQERIVGRKKRDSAELPQPDMHPLGHIPRTRVDEKGKRMEIFRRGVPFGSVNTQGLYIAAFSAERRRFDVMLEQMFGTSADGETDRLMDFTRPTSGAYYFAPSLTSWRSCA